jgi:endonuclease III
VEINVPEPRDVFAAIADVQAEFGGDRRTIGEWRELYRQELATALQGSPLLIFFWFVNNLLERATAAESLQRRLKGFQEHFVSFEAITAEPVSEVLDDASYRFPVAGLKVVMEAKRIVTTPGFTWARYVEQAERFYETDFPKDEFLAIQGVGFKTRDLAVSELSDRFAAMDLHVVRVTARTGLLVHGYGNPEISTDVSTDSGYLFFHGLILRLAKRTGWPGSGYSPGEIDRMLWNFGRAVCKARPDCQACPLAGTCLTSRAVA